MSKKGFTLIELLLVIVLLLTVGALAFWALVKVLSSLSTSVGETKKEVELAFNVDWLIFDLKHAGYGISVNETRPVISYCNGTYNPSVDACEIAQNKGISDLKLLLIRETSNIYRTTRSGDVPSAGFEICNNNELVYKSVKVPSKYRCIFLDYNRLYLKTDTCSCSLDRNPFYVLYPVVEDDICSSPTNRACCENQDCTAIAWFLYTPNGSSSSSGASYPTACKNLGTKILYRSFTYKGDIPIGDGNFCKQIISCVADWDIWFGLDTDNDTVIDRWVNYLPTNEMTSDPDGVNGAMAKQLKMAKVYLLAQASYSPDPDYDYCALHDEVCNTAQCGADKLLIDTLKDGDGTERYVCLKHPDVDAWKHYRWKIVQINVSPFLNIPQPLTTP